MKNLFIMILTTLLFFSCNNIEEKKQEKKRYVVKLLKIDISKTYPEKEIVLQDIAKVEYIPLETKMDVLLEAWANKSYASKDTIVMFNSQQGDIFIFNGKGKFLSKFNHKGEGKNEYSNISKLIFTPKNKEFYVFDQWNKRKVFVYNAKGKFKRSFDIVKNTKWQNITDYNDSLFICSNSDELTNLVKNEDINPQPYIFISKIDGSYVSSVNLNVENPIKTIVVSQKADNSMSAKFYELNHFVHFDNKLLINDISLDTIYWHTIDNQLIPFIVKSPSIASMPDYKKIWLDIKLVTKNYIFMQTAYKTGKQTGEVYKKTDLYLDRKNNKIFRYKLIDKENANRQTTALLSYLVTPEKLIEAMTDNKLSGKLKDVAEQLELDDNQVFVRINIP